MVEETRPPLSSKNAPTEPTKPEEKYFHLGAYLLSRFSFLATHVSFLYFLLYVLNDPFQLGFLTTLDAKEVLPPGECTTFDLSAFGYDALLFSLWWGTHSIMARKAYKKATGLLDSPLERPIFASVAGVVWGITIHFWVPVGNCSKFDPFAVPSLVWAVSGFIFIVAALEILGLLYKLPHHVFGTDRHKYAPGTYPQGGLITSFPYNLVRHPAAAGFLWIYWLGIPSYTINHLVLAGFWTAFILVGTLVFEEGGLVTGDEFGKRYARYRSKVNAFVPSFYSIKRAFGLIENQLADINDPIKAE